MKVVFLDPSFSKTDLKKDYGQIPLHLSRLGYDVEILAYQSKGNSEIESFDGVKLVKLRSFNLSTLPLLYYVFKNRGKIDCVFAYLSISAVFASILFKIARKNGLFILKMDSDGRLYKGSFLFRIFKRVGGEAMFRILAAFSDFLIIESPEAKQRVINLHPWLDKKLFMLPNGINQGELKFNINEKSKKILYVGRIEYGKGVDLLIKAFSKLKDMHPDWNVELVGEVVPSFKDEIEGLLTSELRSRIALIGPLYDEKLIKKYMQAEIFCFPSRSESFGLVLLEAMYFGNSIISSNAGAAEYVLDYGNAGVIFENEDLDGLTRKLESLMKDEKLRKKLAKNAKARCKELFDWKKIIKELDTLIKD